jgi:hypothetical protein
MTETRDLFLLARKLFLVALTSFNWERSKARFSGEGSTWASSMYL